MMTKLNVLDFLILYLQGAQWLPKKMWDFLWENVGFQNLNAVKAIKLIRVLRLYGINIISSKHPISTYFN